MSDAAPPLRIRTQPSPRDPDALRFLLDAPVQHDAEPATFDDAGEDAPLARALFAVAGVRRVEVDGACILIRKSADARWDDMKEPIVEAIRAVAAPGADARPGRLSAGVDARPGAEGEAPQGFDPPLPERVRRHLEALPPSAPTITYGALARALGFLEPGSLRMVTAALEDTMHEDARAGRPFIAARAVSRVGGRLPGRGFFDLALDLARGPQADETERDFHAREMERLEREGSLRS